ncbi:TetR/AcrR family transcriptional regulator [Pseudomaricurvus alkylphenolicus]|uniref:TetR family transcriptional regulator C-terminal domain-containing protein n=1 Tax=Pseudomaricurvus alkylphenolicus TaxID=1306991 RepID=UPI001420BE50|nr:TetR/AcrR family transcriptional regulator [Pseudomaricurvus alkylphenolicus]
MNEAIHGHKPGTAVRKKGQEKVRKILNAAREILANEDDTRLSMSSIAAQAGMHLANVQYYFPTWSDMVEAICNDTASRYEEEYQRIYDSTDEPREKLLRIVEYLTYDNWEAETIGFFTHLWSLSSHDETAARHHHNMYEWQISQLAQMISEAQPDLTKRDAREQATLLISMIDGLIVTTRPDSLKPAARRRIVDKIKATTLFLINID